MEDGLVFCMGGPGIIFSRGLLRQLKGRVSECTDKLLTNHEDLEIGRCVWRLTGIGCTRAEDIDHYYFYQDYKKSNRDKFQSGFNKNINIGTLKLETLDKSATLHANKDIFGQYQTKFKILNNKVTKLNEKIKKIRNEIEDSHNENRLELLFTSLKVQTITIVDNNQSFL